MKKKKLLTYLTVLVLATAASGCHSITVGNAKVRSFGQKTSIKEMEYNPVTGQLIVRGYNNNQVEGMVALFEAGLEAGKKAGGLP